MIRSKLKTPPNPLLEEGALASYRISHPSGFSALSGSSRLRSVRIPKPALPDPLHLRPDSVFRLAFLAFLSFFHLYLTTSSALMSTRPSPVGWAFNAFSKNFFRARGVAPLKKLLCCVSFAALTPLHLKKLSPALCSCGFCSLHKVSKDK